MSKTRLSARIDIKNEYVIKSIQFDGLRKLGDPNTFAKRYYQQGIDEIIFMDAVASLYDRNSLSKIIDQACQEIFVPITVGGGIRTITDIQGALDAGADKVAINTQAIKTPHFIEEGAQIFGCQCLVGSIEAKKKGNKWEAYIDNGREETGLDVVDWAQQLESLGVGEILLTSVDKEGTRQGFDIELINEIAHKISVPLTVAGGAGTLWHIDEVCAIPKIDAISVASMLHYGIESIKTIKERMVKGGHRVRT